MRPILAGWLVLFAGACNTTEGQVELHWAFLDRDSAPVVPGNTLTIPDTCSLLGTFDEQVGPTRYALEVVLHICLPDCEAGCDDPACQVIAPQVFSCETTRATMDIPAGDTPYVFSTEVVARQTDGDSCSCTLTSACVATPGARQRRVTAGLVTDLQVQQLLLTTLDFAEDFDANNDLHLDIATCCEPTPVCP